MGAPEVGVENNDDEEPMTDSKAGGGVDQDEEPIITAENKDQIELDE